VGRRLAGALLAWRAAAERGRAKGDALGRALAHRRRHQLASALRTWRDAAGDASRERRGEAGADAWRRARALGGALVAWRSWAQRKAASRAAFADALERRRAYLLARCFVAWHQVRGPASWQPTAARRFTGRLVGGPASSWLADARLAHTRAQAAPQLAFNRQAKHVAHLSWSERALRKALFGWARMARRGRAARIVSGAARRRALAAALAAWRLAAAGRRRKREILHGASRRLEGGLVRKAWDGWRVSACVGGVCKRAHRHGRRHSVLCCCARDARPNKQTPISPRLQATIERRRDALAGADAALERARRATLWRVLSALRVHAVRSRMARMAVSQYHNARVARCA
jgi:hypothetical protein